MTRLLHANKCTRKLHHLILHSDIKRLSFGATFTRGTSVTWQFLETVRRITKVFSLKTFSSVPSPPLILPTPERLLPQLRLILKDSPLLLLSLMTPNVPFMYSSVCLLWLLWISPTPSAKCYTLESSRDPPWLFFRMSFTFSVCSSLPFRTFWLARPSSCSVVRINCRGIATAALPPLTFFWGISFTSNERAEPDCNLCCVMNRPLALSLPLTLSFAQ